MVKIEFLEEWYIDLIDVTSEYIVLNNPKGEVMTPEEVKEKIENFLELYKKSRYSGTYKGLDDIANRVGLPRVISMVYKLPNDDMAYRNYTIRPEVLIKKLDELIEHRVKEDILKDSVLDFRDNTLKRD